VNKNNKWDENASVFVRVKVWIKRSLNQSEGRGSGRERVRVEDQGLEGKGPKCSPVVRQEFKVETAHFRSEEGERWDGSDVTTVFQEAASFL
jgi:hypothetical protein